jgi:hypothetical protein
VGSRVKAKFRSEKCPKIVGRITRDVASWALLKARSGPFCTLDPALPPLTVSEVLSSKAVEASRRMALRDTGERQLRLCWRRVRQGQVPIDSIPRLGHASATTSCSTVSSRSLYGCAAGSRRRRDKVVNRSVTIFCGVGSRPAEVLRYRLGTEEIEVGSGEPRGDDVRLGACLR